MDANLIYAIMYMEINVISIMLVFYIHQKNAGLTQMVAQRNFTMALDAEIFFFLSDMLYVLMVQGLMPYTPALAILFKSGYFISTALMCFFWFVYFEYLQDSPFVQNRKNVLISSALVWLMGVLLIVNVFTGVCFGINKDGQYERGPLFIALYLLSYPYVIFTCLRALLKSFRKKYYSQRKMLLRLAFFPVLPAIAGVIQFIHPRLPVACLALSFATLVMYMEWTEQMISVDPLTHLGNRKNLEYHYDQWRGNKEEHASLYLLMIDANKFKSINDTYGHVQGDLALIRIADAMRLALRGHNRRFNIARYGGDEFAILVWSEDEKDIVALKTRIADELARLNKEADSPYDLTVSIGAHKALADMPIKTLIEKADELLYEEKKKLGYSR